MEPSRKLMKEKLRRINVGLLVLESESVLKNIWRHFNGVITSAKEVMFSSAFICLLAGLGKN